MDGALIGSRFGLHSLRPFIRLGDAKEIRRYLKDGDILFLVTVERLDRTKRWHWTSTFRDLRIGGICHVTKCLAPENWQIFILTDSPTNPIHRAKPYFQVEEPDNFRSNNERKIDLPKSFFLVTGRFEGILKRSSVSTLNLAKQLPYPIVIVGHGAKEAKQSLEGLGSIHCGLSDSQLATIAEKSTAVLYLGDPRKAPEYLQKISGCFSLALKYGKPLICLQEFWQSHGFRNGITLGDKISLADLNSAAVSAKVQRKEMITKNEETINSLTRDRIVVIPPVRGTGSLGDQAVVRSVVTRLQAKGKSLAMALASSNWIDLLPTNPDGSKIESIGDDVSEYDTVIYCGTDVADGRYGPRRKERALCERGRKSYVVGVSMTSAKFLDGLGVSGVTVRDADSLKYLDGYPTTSCADPAFLLTPTAPSQKVISWLESSPGEIIGISLPCLKAVEPWLSYISARFPNASLFPLPHDFRPQHPDIKVSDHTISIAKQIGLRVWSHGSIRSPSTVKWITSKADVVLSSRMHLCIAALGSGTPVIAFSYDRKFLHLQNLFGENVYIFENGSHEPIVGLLERLMPLRGCFVEMLDHVKSLAASSIPQIP